MEEANAFARLHKMPYVETSAKLGTHVEEAFFVMTELIYRLA